MIAQAVILGLFLGDVKIAFLWYNLFAPAILIVSALLLQALLPKEST